MHNLMHNVLFSDNMYRHGGGKWPGRGGRGGGRGGRGVGGNSWKEFQEFLDFKKSRYSMVT